MMAMVGLGGIEIVILAVVLLGIMVTVGAVVVASTSRKDSSKPESSSNAGLIITIVLGVVVVVLVCGGLLAFAWLAMPISDPNQNTRIIYEDRTLPASPSGDPLPPDTVEVSPNQ